MSNFAVGAGSLDIRANTSAEWFQQLASENGSSTSSQAAVVPAQCAPLSEELMQKEAALPQATSNAKTAQAKADEERIKYKAAENSYREQGFRGTRGERRTHLREMEQPMDLAVRDEIRANREKFNLQNDINWTRKKLEECLADSPLKPMS